MRDLVPWQVQWYFGWWLPRGLGEVHSLSKCGDNVSTCHVCYNVLLTCLEVSFAVHARMAIGWLVSWWVLFDGVPIVGGGVMALLWSLAMVSVSAFPSVALSNGLLQWRVGLPWHGFGCWLAPLVC